MKIICYTPSKNSDCKIQITLNKNANLKYFISLIDIVSNTDYLNFK